jgi:hypothetical protein
MERLETHIREAFDKAAEGQFNKKEGENFYHLLGAYRGLSESLVEYAGSASVFDWSLWTEEKF